MRPPFPGMDPWLESPTLWPDVHNSLITSIRDALAPRLAPRYFVGVESRTTSADRPRYRPGLSDRTSRSTRRNRERGVRGIGRGGAGASGGQTFRVVGARSTRRSKRHFLTIQELPGRKLVTVDRSPLADEQEDRRTHGRST